MTVTAAEEPPVFSATFNIVINSIKTATVDNMVGVIKQVEWTLKGTEEGQAFELPQKTILPPPEPDKFIPLDLINDPSIVVTWIETSEPRLTAMKSHIQLVLDKMVAEANLAQTPLPWAPPPAAGPATPPAP